MTATEARPILTPDHDLPLAWDEGDLIVWGRLHCTAPGRATSWNGFVCPAFDRKNVDLIIGWNAAHPEAEVDQLAWDGDALVTTRPQYEGSEPERDEGFVDEWGVRRWSPGAWSWTWQLVEQPGCRLCGWSQVGRFEGDYCPKCNWRLDWR